MTEKMAHNREKMGAKLKVLKFIPVLCSQPSCELCCMVNFGAPSFFRITYCTIPTYQKEQVFLPPKLVGCVVPQILACQIFFQVELIALFLHSNLLHTYQKVRVFLPPKQSQLLTAQQLGTVTTIHFLEQLRSTIVSQREAEIELKNKLDCALLSLLVK